jgi:hypothetical protein
MLSILARPRRRTHLFAGDAPMCGTRTALDGGTFTPVDVAGGATPRLMRELSLHLDGNTCLRCTRLAGMVLLMYGVRDTGKAMRSW